MSDQRLLFTNKVEKEHRTAKVSAARCFSKGILYRIPFSALIVLDNLCKIHSEIPVHLTGCYRTAADHCDGLLQLA
jgi:hypothetical protein